MTASSAFARLHGHERRHAHHQEARAVGDEVVATIAGHVATWANDWTGNGVASATEAPAPPPAAPTVAPAPAPEDPTSTISVVHASATAEASAGGPSPSAPSAPSEAPSSGNSDWTKIPEGNVFSTKGFGKKTASGGSGIEYKGNVGDPWGSNIIEVSPDEASNYKHVTQFKGNNAKPWTIVFWNKLGPDGKMDGWFGKQALKLTLQPHDTKYVAYDDDSQGGWAAAEGDEVPKDFVGGWAATWGEFDFSSTVNNGWSGWDVSAIQAQNAKLPVQGMKICAHDGGKCSSVKNGGSELINAYSNALAKENGIGGNQGGQGPVRLTVEIDY